MTDDLSADLAALARSDRRARRAALMDLRSIGRDPLSLLRADRAALLDPAWVARLQAGAPLLYWGEGEDEDEMPPSRFTLEGNVGVVDVIGPLASRGWFCVDGYDTIALALEEALKDARAVKVLLNLDSPGGAAAGCFEWCSRMREMIVASGKHVVAYSNEMALSGAYAIACIADEIVVPETGVVGSVGVITSMVSQVKRNEIEGLDVRVIQAGDEKADGHPDKALDEAAVARVQAEVNQLADVFYRWVSSRRGMTPAAVAALQAGVRMGAAGVDVRLADRVLGYHALLAEMQSGAPATSPAPAAPPATSAHASRSTPRAAQAPRTTTRSTTMPTQSPTKKTRVEAPAPAPATPDAPAENAAAAPSEPCSCAGKTCPACDGTMACRVCGGVCELCMGTGICPAHAETDAAPAAEAAASRLHGALAEATGKIDVEGQIGALGVLMAKASAHDQALARAVSAETALRSASLERLIEKGRAEGKLTPAQVAKAEGDRPAGWARRQSPEALEAFLADAPVVIPRGAINPPSDPARGDAQLPVDVAAAVAKARSNGWLSLSATERHEVTAHDAELAQRLASERK